MKKLFKGILLILMLCTLFGVSVYAEGTGGSGTGGEGGGTGSGSVINGPSYKKTGFVFYIVDGSGNIVAEPKTVVSLNVYPDSSHISYIDTRFGGRKGLTISNGSIQSCPAWGGYTPFNSSSSGNGGVIKNHLISNGVNGKPEAANFINYYWGASVEEAFKTNDDQCLIIEPFLWTSLYKGSQYAGNIVGTSLGWVEARERINAPDTSSNSTYTIGNLPNSMAFDIPVLGVPAPTSLTGTHSYNDIKSMGYGIIAVWSSEVAIPEEVPEDPGTITSENADAIKSDELNYIYKNFSGSRSGSKTGFEISKIDMNKYRKHTGEHNDGIDDYSVAESKSGDLWNFKGNNVLFYRPANCSQSTWLEAAASKNFGKDVVTSPQYAYNISRALWGDNLVLCNFYGKTANSSGSSTTYRDYAKNQLGINTGNTGSVTGVSAGVNVDGTYGVSKSDNYSFQGSTTEHWQTWHEGHTDEDGTVHSGYYEDHSEGISSDLIQYSVVHSLDKYKVKDTEISSNSNAGSDAYLVRHPIFNAVTRAGFSTQSADVLTMYPEVEMTMNYTSETSTFYDNYSAISVYVMGEKARQTHSPIMHTYSAGFTSGSSSKGLSIAYTASTGSNVQELLDAWKNQLNNQAYCQVLPQGTGWSTGTENNPKITVFSYN